MNPRPSSSTSAATDRKVELERLRRELDAEREARIAAEKRAQLASDFIENGSVGLHWVGPDGTILWANRTELDLLGYAREEYVGRSITEFHTDQEVIGDILCRLGRNETLHNYEAKLRCKNGDVKTVLINSNVLWSDGKFIHTRCFTRDISEIKRQALAMRESEERYRTLLDQANDAILLADAESGTIVDANQRAAALLGRPIEQLKGMHQTQLHPPEKIEEYGKIFREHAGSGGGMVVRDIFVRNAVGTDIPVEISASVIRLNGKPVLQGIFRDVTERKRAEAQVEAERSLLNTVLEAAPVGVCIAEASGRLVSLSPAMRRIWGDEAPLANTVNDYRTYRGWFGMEESGRLVAPHEWPLSRVLAGEQVVAPEVFRIEPLNAPGSRRVVAMSAASVQDASGKTIAAVAMVFDITDLAAAQATVRDSESRFRALADNIPQLAWIAEANGYIFWYNRRWFDYTGSTLEQMQGWGWQSVHHPDHVARITQKFRAHLASEEPFEDTFPLRGVDGSFRWFLTRVIPLRDEAGIVTRWFGTNTDVTEQREVEEALRCSNTELEQFAFVAAHDLQEPLRTISLYTEMLLRKLETPDPQLQGYGERIRSAAQRMRTLLTDLLTYSRVVHQSGDETVAHADLNAAFAQAQQTLGEAIAVSGAQVTSEQLPVVRGDVGQLAMVFQNLLGNALKYQVEGSKPEVSVAARQCDGRWIISVKDNGIGFAPEHAERIFGLFKRLHGSRYPGTGLGLAICRRIVERDGGRLWAESAGEGSGATFVVELQAVEGG